MHAIMNLFVSLSSSDNLLAYLFFGFIPLFVFVRTANFLNDFKNEPHNTLIRDKSLKLAKITRRKVNVFLSHFKVTTQLWVFIVFTS